jgi:Flp pilus assembly protein TadD
MRHFLSVALAAVLLAAFTPAATAQMKPAAPAEAQELVDARRLLRTGEGPAALALVDKAIAAKPQDPGARFLKGVILSEMNRPDEAFQVFFVLTQDHPELAEPYNNMGVIYAARGDFERARQALETAVLARPDYGVAYENLGDVYAQLSIRAYERATQLPGATRAAGAKLALARELAAYAPRAKPVPVKP